jgi:hypothetical protein
LNIAATTIDNITRFENGQAVERLAGLARLIPTRPKQAQAVEDDNNCAAFVAGTVVVGFASGLRNERALSGNLPPPFP